MLINNLIHMVKETNNNDSLNDFNQVNQHLRNTSLPSKLIDIVPTTKSSAVVLNDKMTISERLASYE
jgi:hypothetical protein